MTFKDECLEAYAKQEQERLERERERMCLIEKYIYGMFVVKFNHCPDVVTANLKGGVVMCDGVRFEVTVDTEEGGCEFYLDLGRCLDCHKPIRPRVHDESDVGRWLSQKVEFCVDGLCP